MGTTEASVGDRTGARLRGKTALITGAARRVGRAVAEALADAGADVVVHYHTSADDAGRLCDALRHRGVRPWAIQADLGDARQCETLVQRALTEAGALHILINAASTFPRGSLDDLTVTDLSTNLQVNAWAPLLLSRAFARSVDRGHIVNLLDSKIVAYNPGHVPYLLSKQVLALLTRQMAMSWAPRIAVNAVAPGLILPPDGTPEGHHDPLMRTVPMQRMGEPQDVAEAVLYLVGSRYVTGQVLFVDGGWHLRAAHSVP